MTTAPVPPHAAPAHHAHGPRAASVLLVLAVALVAASVVMILLRWAHLPDSTGWIALQTLSPVGGVLAVLGLLAALAARSRGAVLAALPALLAAAVLTWPTVHRTTVPAGPRDLTVLSTNLLLGSGSSQDVLAHAERLRADVVVLVEVTPEALAQLDRAGLAGRYPHRVGEAAPWASGLVVASRHPLTASSHVTDGRAATPWATVHAPGGDVLVRGVHPSAPTSPDVWRADLATLQHWVEGLDPQTPVVLAGDFNATFSHPPFRQAVAGLTDTARAAGRGWNPTWPQDRRLPPFAEIDHVLVRHVDVVDAGSVAVDGTDHRAVWGRVRVGR